MRFFLLLLFIVVPAQAQSHDWTVHDKSAELTVHAVAEGDKFTVTWSAAKSSKLPLKVSLNVLPPDFVSTQTYDSMGLRRVSPNEFTGTVKLPKGTSQLELTLFFEMPRSQRASSEQSDSVRLTGWTVTR